MAGLTAERETGFFFLGIVLSSHQSISDSNLVKAWRSLVMSRKVVEERSDGGA